MKIKVKVKPNSKQQNFETVADDSLLISLKSSLVSNKANCELVATLSRKYRVTKLISI